MRYIVFFVISIVITFSFSACPSGSVMGLAGSLITVDSKNHFTQDISYHQWSGIFKYNADGTYEEIYYNYESPNDTYDYNGNGATGEGWVQSGGSRGTYVYELSSYKMTRTETSWYGTWRDNPSSRRYIYASMAYYAEHQFGNVYKQDGSKWVNTGKNTYIDSANSNNNSDNSYTITLSLSEGTAGYHYQYENTYTPSSGVSITTYRRDEIGDLEFIPYGTTLEKGKTVTCRIKMTASTYQNYDWTNNVLNQPISDSYLYYQTNTYSFLGGFLIYYPSTMSHTIQDNQFRF